MNKNRELLVKIILGSTEPVSCEKSTSLSYLKEEGLDADAIKAEGIKRLKKLQLQLNTVKTKQDMLANEKAKQAAADWAEKILSDISFSFSDFVRNEKMVLQNRNIASFTKDDIRHTLTQYLFMKIISSDKPSHAE